MTPQLSIDYSSQGSDTTMGLGFGLSGLSQIARCPAGLIQDDVVDPVDLDAYDRFCLDGQRLVTSSTYGAVGAGYRTEIESFTKIASSGGQAFNPASWTAKTKSGITMTYGGVDSARYGRDFNGVFTTYVWLLSRSEDTAGNWIEYRWTTADNQYRIQEIRYGGNIHQGQDYNQRVSFEYQARSGYIPTGWLYARKIQQSQLLKAVKSYTLGSSGSWMLARNWTLSYNHSVAAVDDEPPGSLPPPCGGNGTACPRLPARDGRVAADSTKVLAMDRYVLTSVQECFDASNCLPTTNFSWSDVEGTTAAIANVSYDNLQADYDEFPADVDNDGTADLIGARVTSSGQVNAFVLVNGNGAKYGSSAQYLFRDSEIAVGDFNADGRADVGVASDDASCGNPVHFLPGGTDYKFGTPIGNPLDDMSGCGSSSSSGNGEFDSVMAGELTGDGRDDMLLIRNNGDGLKFRRVVSKGDSFSGGGWYTPTNAAGDMSSYAPYGAEFNGDGLLDVVLIKKTSSGVWAKVCMANMEASPFHICGDTAQLFSGDLGDKPPLIGDANGDGYLDVVLLKHIGATAYAWTYLSKGNGNFDAVIESVLDMGTTAQYTMGGDYDGDGILDIAWVRKSSGATSVRLWGGTGSGAFNDSDTISDAYTSLPDPAEWNLYAADFSGEGRARLMLYCDADAGSDVRLFKFQSYPNLRVRKMTNGLGASVSIEYLTQRDTNVYAPDGVATVYPERDLRIPQKLVSQHETTGPSVETRTVSYKYYGSRLHLRGRGALGFSKMEVRDLNTGIMETSTMSQEYPSIGMPISGARKITSSGTPIATTATTYKATTLSMGQKFVYADIVTAADYEITAGYTGVVKTTVTNTAYDDYGNATTVDVKVYQGSSSGGIYFQTHTTNEYTQEDSAQWWLGRLTRSTVRHNNPDGTSKARTTAFGYSTHTGLLSAEIVEPDDTGTLYLRTDYTRDAFGNITRTSVSDYAGNARATTAMAASSLPPPSIAIGVRTPRFVQPARARSRWNASTQAAPAASWSTMPTSARCAAPAWGATASGESGSRFTTARGASTRRRCRA